MHVQVADIEGIVYPKFSVSVLLLKKFYQRFGAGAPGHPENCLSAGESL